MVFYNVVISELFGTSPFYFTYPKIPTVQQFLNYERTFEFTRGSGLENIVAFASIWPNYTAIDPTIGQYAMNTSTSILFLNGNLDPQTPFEYADYAYNIYKNNATKKLIEFNGLHHGIFLNPCGFNIITKFLQQSGNISNIDTSCLSSLIVDFTANSSTVKELSKQFFGTDNVWGDRQPVNPSNSFPWTIVYIVIGVGVALIIFIIFYIRNRSRDAEKELLLNKRVNN